MPPGDSNFFVMFSKLRHASPVSVPVPVPVPYLLPRAGAVGGVRGKCNGVWRNGESQRPSTTGAPAAAIATAE